MKATFNGKEAELYTERDIAKAFTKLVFDLLQGGYSYFYDSYKDVQPGFMTSALTNDEGKTVCVLRADKRRVGLHSIEMIHLTAKRYETHGHNTLWADQGKLEYEEMYYSISSHWGDVHLFVKSLDDCEAILDYHWNRVRSRYANTSGRVLTYGKEAALKMLRKVKGHKSKTLKDIEKVSRVRNQYVVTLTDGRQVTL